MAEREVLQSWKEISAYLDRDIRTCRRWEEHLGLPIHRLDGSSKARVLAYKDEIDRWLDAKLHERQGGTLSAVASGAGTRTRFLRRWYILIAFAALSVIGVLGWRAVSNSRPRVVPSGGLPAIAVLPFVNGTGDEGLNYLRESVPDHLIRDLQRSGEHLRVFSFDNVAEAVRRIGLEPGATLSPDDLAAVAARTGARWLLIGSLSRAGTKIRIDYEVREPRAVQALMKDHLPGAEADIAVLEARVANGVRRAFGVMTSAGSDPLKGCSIQATRFYETARAIQRKYALALAPDDLERMIDLLNRARLADPGCPLAYLGLGDAFQLRFVFEGRAPESLRLMNENYRYAYDMAPERAETNIGLGWLHFFGRDNDQAYRSFRTAMELDPSSLHVLTEVGAFLRSIGVLERSIEYFSRVINAGGPNASILMNRAWSYEHMGLYESALADLDKLAELDPADFMIRCIRARVLVLMKRYEAASAELAVADSLAPGEPTISAVRALIAAARGDRKAALDAMAAVEEPGRPVRFTYFRSRVFAVLGMRDQAVDNIEQAIEKGFDEASDYLYGFPFLNNTRDYFFDRLRGDPRFSEILRRQERAYVGYLKEYGGL